MTLTQTELEAIKERVEAATEGPWEALKACFGSVGHEVHGDEYVIAGTFYEQNAEFIAAARQDVPKLLADIERLQENLRSVAALSTCSTTRDFAKRALDGTLDMA